MIYEDMSLDQVIEYINFELLEGRSMKDIEENDFNVNERVIVKRLARKNIKKVNGQFVFIESYKKTDALKNEITAIPKVEIIQERSLSLIENKEFLDLSNKVDILEKTLKELIRTQNSSNLVPKDLGLRISNYSGKPVAKTIRLYKELWDKLDLVKEKFPHLNYQILINSLMDEITEKYLKNDTL